MSRTPAVFYACPAAACRNPGPIALAYADCCGRFIDHWDASPRPTPNASCVALHRLCAQATDYLLALHPATAPTLDFDTQWLGLRKCATSRSVETYDHAEVRIRLPAAAWAASAVAPARTQPLRA